MCLFSIIKFDFWCKYFSKYFLKPSEALHIICTANISKSLWILYQISKVFLNYPKLSAMTLPHLTGIANWKECYYFSRQNLNFNAQQSLCATKFQGRGRLFEPRSRTVRSGLSENSLADFCTSESLTKF